MNPIAEYWNDRAASSKGATTATTNDVYLRVLELKTLIETVPGLITSRPARLLDVGCGDGYTTIGLARAVPDLQITAVDVAENMLDVARERLEAEAESVQSRVGFRLGDAVDLESACGEEMYDLAVTTRCLINLGTPERQFEGLSQIARRLRPHGHYVCIENFMEGQDEMNRARALFDLPEIPVRWHNLFFREDEFRSEAARHFDQIEIHNFASIYYFATRVVYAAMCRLEGVEPDYEHPIHQISPNLPWAGNFSPIRMALLRRRADGNGAASSNGR